MDKIVKQRNIHSPITEGSLVLDTMPKILYRNLLEYGNRVAMRKKHLGIWQQYTWSDVFRHVKQICLGLSALGAQKGDKVVIIGNNDPELVWAQWGAQHAQLVVVCLYVDSLPDEVKYFIRDSQAKFVFCEDQEQVDKIIQIQSDCPLVEKVIYWDPKGLWCYDEPYLMSLELLEKLGDNYEIEHPKLFEENISRIKPSDPAIIIYTSGTTGLPKGKVQTYDETLEYAIKGIRRYNIRPWDEYVSYASPAWAEQIVGMAICPMLPMVTSFAEEPETVAADVRDIGPALLWYPGRLWEDLARRIRIKIEDTSAWKRVLFNGAMKISYKRLSYIENDKTVPLILKAVYYLADFIALRPVRDYFGLKKAYLCGSGGAAISRDHARFFRALGVPFCNLYGIVEAGMISGLLPQDIKYESIGQPNWGKEIRIEDGQILVHVGSKRQGYWNRPGAWEDKVKNGWYQTGDAGWIDEEGYLFYIDRVEEMTFLKNGYHFSPQFIELKLRYSPYIKDAAVFGTNEDYITAIVSCDFGMVSKWAESHHIPYTTLVELSQLPQVIQLLREEIRKINSSLPAELQIRKFVSLHKEFDPDEAELTRSRKLKRTELARKYNELLKAMYEDRPSFTIETLVTYKDGRKGTITATLAINRVDKNHA